jgi:hypothetical protein
MPTETEAVRCNFTFTKVSYYCIDDGGMYHSPCSDTSIVAIPEDVETLEDALRWLDKERDRSEKFRCKSCRSGGMVWHSLQMVAKAVITLDYSTDELLAARRRVNGTAND